MSLLSPFMELMVLIELRNNMGPVVGKNNDFSGQFVDVEVVVTQCQVLLIAPFW